MLKHGPPWCLSDFELMFEGITVDGSSSYIPRQVMMGLTLWMKIMMPVKEVMMVAL